MKKIALSAMLGMLLFSCTKTDVNSYIQPEGVKPADITVKPNKEVRRVGEGGCEATFTSVPLMAGQTEIAGMINVFNDGVDLTVTYTTTGIWSMTEIHLYVGEYALAPQNNGGNPMPGRFPIKQTFTPTVTTYTHTMPLSSLPECFIVAAHAVVKRSTNGSTETGWGQGQTFSGNNWGMFFDYCYETCE